MDQTNALRRGHGLGRAVDWGNRDVDGAGWVVIGATSGTCDRQVIFILTEDIRTKDGQIDVVHGDLTHFWQVDGHLSGLQMEEACLVDDCTKISWQECGEPHNLELCSPNIGCDLSKVVLLSYII